MSNITVTHADSGLMHADVVEARRISPHVMRVTLGGSELERFTFRGFDQWFRLAIPVADEGALDKMPRTFGLGGYLRYLALPRGTRPVVRNYTVREYRPNPAEIDVDFVVHGEDGVAGPWAASATVGSTVALIDQGCGFQPSASTAWTLLVADESGLPAVAGIVRDLPREATGRAIIEVPDIADAQELNAPEGVSIRWIVREPQQRIGAGALDELRRTDIRTGGVQAFAVGESSLAAGARRHLVNECGVPKSDVTFCGYWKQGRPASR